MSDHTPPPAPEKPKRPFYKKKRYAIPAALFFALIVGSALGGAGQEQPEAAAETADEVAEDTTEAEVADETTTTTEAEPASIEEVLTDEWSDDVEAVREIEFFERNDRLRATVLLETPAIAVGDIIRDEIADVVQDVSKLEGQPVNEFALIANMELIDELGNPNERMVLVVSWDRETIHGINWTNFNTLRILEVGDVTQVHPALAAEFE